MDAASSPRPGSSSWAALNPCRKISGQAKAIRCENKPCAQQGRLGQRFQFNPRARSTGQTSRFGGSLGCFDSLSFLVLPASLLLFASLSPLPPGTGEGQERRAGRQGQKGSNFTVWYCSWSSLSLEDLTDIPVLASLGNGMTLCSGSTVQLYQSIFISINPF